MLAFSVSSLSPSFRLETEDTQVLEKGFLVWLAAPGSFWSLERHLDKEPLALWV